MAREVWSPLENDIWECVPEVKHVQIESSERCPNSEMLIRVRIGWRAWIPGFRRRTEARIVPILKNCYLPRTFVRIEVVR